MLKFSPCIEMFWHDLPHAERIRKVAQLGFEACEFWNYAGKDLDAIEAALKDTGLKLAGCCVDNSYDGPPMLVPEGTAPFVEAVKAAVPISRRLDVQTFIVTTGNELAEVPHSVQHQAVVQALKAAAPVAEDAGITLVLEPLNVLVDHKGYFLVTSTEGFEIIDEVASPNVKLLFDIYHQQISEGNLSLNLLENLDKVGHIHTANHPGRIELSKGEINYPFLLQAIKDSSYAGYVGLEYKASDPARTDELVKEALSLV